MGIEGRKRDVNGPGADDPKSEEVKEKLLLFITTNYYLLLIKPTF